MGDYNKWMKKNLTFRQKLKRRFLFPLTAFFIVFVILELVFIFLEPVLFKGFYQYDPDMGFKVRPHARNTNRLGFNDKDWPLEKEPGTFRIVVLSDSFNWSMGRDKNYVGQLGRMFNERYRNKKIEVINIGYPMTHPGEQLVLLMKYGMLYDPDLVCLGVFVGNDFLDAEPNRKRIVLNDTYIDIDRRYEVTIFGYPIVAKSRVFLFLKQKFTVIMELMKARSEEDGAVKKKSSFLFAFDSNPPADTEKKKKPDPRKPTFSEDTYLGIEFDRLRIFSIENQASGLFEPNMEYIFRSIKEMSDRMKEKEIEFIVGIYPDEFQVYDELLEKVLQRFDLKREDYDIELLQKRLTAFLEENDIPFVDLLPRFREEGKNRDLYKLRDSHWNEDGNLLAAEVLYPAIEKLVDTADTRR